MKKLKVYGIYGTQKINGVSCLKAGGELTDALIMAGIKPIKAASYSYFNLSGVATSRATANAPKWAINKGKGYLSFDFLSEERAQQIYDELHKTIPNYLDHYVLFE